MANIASSKKDARRSARRAVANRSVRSAVKTRIVKVRRAAASNDVENLDELAVAAISSLDRAASKGILHRNNAARRKSRLMKRLSALRTGGSEAIATATGKAAGRAGRQDPSKRTAPKRTPAKKGGRS